MKTLLKRASKKERKLGIGNIYLRMVEWRAAEEEEDKTRGEIIP